MMAAQRAPEHQRAIAERNVEAILDAVEVLLEQRAQASISAVAKQAGVSRVTVYSHFPTGEALLEAAVGRAVNQTMAALQAVGLDDGPPVEALERMLAAAWRHLARYGAMAQAVSEQMSAEAVARTHQAAHQTIGALVRRGQGDGSFRGDLPAGWLVTACVDLIHACADEVRAGRIDTTDAVAVLTTTVRDLFTGPPAMTAAITLTPIGTVQGGRTEIYEDHWGPEISRLVLDPAAVDPEATLGLGEFSHLEVVFYFHRETRIRRGATHPRGNPAWPRVGVLAGHSPVRPNHLGVSRCALLDVNGLELTVQGLDAIDGTPILDIKPYATGFQPQDPVREPPWIRELMDGYY